MVPDDLLAYVRAALPAPPARVLEVGAGSGELAEALRAVGHDVVAIDPEPSGPGVLAVPLLELDGEAASFDAAVAALSLHHVEPLAPSCAGLAEVLRPGGPLVVDEFDVGSFDERAAAWLIAQRRAAGLHVPAHPDRLAADVRSHLHPVAAVQAALETTFDVGARPVPGAYLYRWGLHPGLRAVEEAAIAAGELPATGARFVAVRR